MPFVYPGKWTVQEAAEQAVACPTIVSAVDARNLSALLDERKEAAKVLTGPSISDVHADKNQLIQDVRHAVSVHLLSVFFGLLFCPVDSRYDERSKSLTSLFSFFILSCTALFLST